MGGIGESSHPERNIRTLLNSMKPYLVVSIALILLGIAALAYQGITYTTREKAIDLGPLQVTTEQKHTLPLPPILGVVALLGGVALFVMGGRKSW
jgi:hypothetical protein